jgi:hypothetical protein
MLTFTTTDPGFMTPGTLKSSRPSLKPVRALHFSRGVLMGELTRICHSHLQWVGHQEVARGEIWGTWKRFTYFCNGHKLFIYCHNFKTFLALFASWCSWARGLYNYTLTDPDGEDISTQDIIFDRPEGSPFRVKLLIQTTVGEYIQ